MRSSSFILDYLLPYFITSMEDESTLVQVEAAEGGITLLEAIKTPVTLLPIDFNVFQLYIFPAYQKLGNKDQIYMKSTFMKLIGKLCRNGKRFIEQGVLNQTNYIKSLRESEHNKGGFKEKKVFAIDFYFATNKTISNSDTIINDMSKMLMGTLKDFICRNEEQREYFSAIVKSLDDIWGLLGLRDFEAVISLMNHLLNLRNPMIMQAIFKHSPQIDRENSVIWVYNSLNNYAHCIRKTNELLIFEVIKCFTNFVKMKLIPKNDMIKLYGEFAPLVLHPNNWIRCVVIDYCKEVNNSLADLEVFLSLREILQKYVKDFMMITSTDPFYDFLMQPLSRIIFDLIEAGISEPLFYTENDECTRPLFEDSFKFENIGKIEDTNIRKKRYDNYMNKLKAGCKSLTLNCIGSTLNLAAAGQLPILQESSDKSTFTLCNGFEVHEKEADYYIDKQYIMQIIPNATSFYNDNNGFNSIQNYLNYLSTNKSPFTWKDYYKSASICKALKFYAQDEENERQRRRQGRSYSSTIRQWKPQGRLMVNLNSHKAPVYSVAVSDDMKMMATGSIDGVCCIWNVSRLKETVALPLTGQIETPGKISCLSFLENTYNIAIGTEEGFISVYKVDNNFGTPIIKHKKEVSTTEEGGIVDCCTYLTHEGHNVLVYATQKGGIHVHDIRVKNDVNVFQIGCRRGIVTRFCMGRDENNFFVSTVGGYVIGYDLRFNLITSMRKYTRGTPITDMCAYLPEKLGKVLKGDKVHMNNVGNDIAAPLLFIASGGKTSQVDLCSLDKETPEWSFAVGNPKDLYQNYAPYVLRKEELNYTDLNQIILKRLTKGFAVTGEELKSNNEVNFASLHFAFKDFHKKMKAMYSSESCLYKILCPRLYRSEESAPFLLTASADKVVRYWYLGDILSQKESKDNAQEMAKQSFIVMSPDNRNVNYSVKCFDGKVLYERPIHSKKLNKDWQSQNGVSYMKDGVSRIPCAGHTDAILNMELIDLNSVKYLVTCGRDNLVKLWV